MSEAKAIHEQIDQADKDWGKEMRISQAKAQERLRVATLEQDIKYAKKAGLTLKEFQDLCASETRVVASALAPFIPHDASMSLPLRIEAARKSYEVLHPDETRKDLR